MRRIMVVLAIAALVAVMLAGSAASALAQEAPFLAIEVPEEACDELQENDVVGLGNIFTPPPRPDQCFALLPGHPQFDPGP